MNLEYYTTRELPCECLALVTQPFPDCPCCYGTGTSEQDVIVDVEYEYYKASRGSRDRYGCPVEPDEPAFVEILETSIPLTVGEYDRCEEKCLEDAEGRREEAIIEFARRLSRYE